MRSSAAEGFSGLLQWSDPVIYDRLREAYAGRLCEAKVARQLARMHARVWRSLLEGRWAAVENLRADLMAALDAHEVDHDCLAEADARTMQELVEIVVSRFQRSPRDSMNYHMALLELAGRIAPTHAPLPLAA